MHSDAGDWPSRQPGSPIRTPPDQRSVDSSPGPIAASHVLHRLLVPRHPPCALNHLHTHTHPATRPAHKLNNGTTGPTFGIIKALQQKPDPQNPSGPWEPEIDTQTANPPPPQKHG